MQLKFAIKPMLSILALVTMGAGTANAGCGEFISRGGYTVLRNSCSQTITFRWRDQGACRNGCAARVSGGSEQSVSSPQGDYRLTED